ncbi:hypothetical protein BDA96_04G137900 [Sorghum bicolor]|uniref:Glabrous enhancer-binding protein-like DBD domain-containing protein n=1 Tax=Sorghum bicolor TaxID=4558 RepID=A0A921UIY3_SORBI|nr:hypothetical protein BDA96_04G137900 [Sorghum bicolor]
MARKRRAPPPPPPPPPPQEESSSEESGSEELEETPRLPAHRRSAQAAANNADSSEAGSESDTDVQAFQMRQVPRSSTKHSHPAPQPESGGEEEEEGESSESEPENPVPVVQKKRPASDPAPTGKAKRAKAGEEKAVAGAEASPPPAKAKKGKAELEKPAPEASPAGKAKKGKAELEKPAPDASPAGKAKKGKAEKAAPEATPTGLVRWGKDDEKKILEALAAHVKSEGVLPKTDLLLASVRDRLVRKSCTYSDIYEKVRRLKDRYEKAVSTGIVPSTPDGLQMYNLSEEVWGEKAREAAAAVTSQKGGAVTKGKKGQANKEKMDGNAKGGVAKEAAPSTANQSGDSQQGSKKGQPRLSEEATTTAYPRKSKKQESHNEELNKDGGHLAKGKKGKTDKGKMDRDTDSVTPEETINANQNGGTLIRDKEGEIKDQETEGDANVQGVRRGFDELQKLYSNLAVYVEEIEAHHPCGETLKRAFGSIADERAEGLESKIKKQRVAEAKAKVRQGDIKKEVLNLLLSLVD